jgi:hypothetical protein
MWFGSALLSSSHFSLLWASGRPLILKQLGLEYPDQVSAGGLPDEVKALAENPARKIEAIGLYRKQTGVSLGEAVDVVEAYMAGRRVQR